MATLQINVDTTGAQRQSVVLDGVQYGLRIQWVQRWRRFVLSLFEADETTPIVQGVLVAGGLDLLAQWRSDPRVPPGQLGALPLSAPLEDPSFPSDLTDGEFLLIYIESTQ